MLWTDEVKATITKGVRKRREIAWIEAKLFSTKNYNTLDANVLQSGKNVKVKRNFYNRTIRPETTLKYFRPLRDLRLCG